MVFIDNKLRFRLLCDQPICPTAALYLPSHAIGANIGTLDTCLQCNIPDYTRHTSSCMCVGCLRSPQSLTHVSSWGLAQLPPSCNSNYLGYK
ncbi:hypothetical protein CS537_09460 [Yersinia mollaretii]|nr:hypothetical protein CS537_09460 [Yersinia mollaretii]